MIARRLSLKHGSDRRLGRGEAVGLSEEAGRQPTDSVCHREGTEIRR